MKADDFRKATDASLHKLNSGKFAEGIDITKKLESTKIKASPKEKDITEAVKAGKKAKLAPLAKDGVELGGHESPSPNVKIGKQPIPKALLDILGDKPIKGVVAQDVNTSILPKHNIIDRPDLRDK